MFKLLDVVGTRHLRVFARALHDGRTHQHDDKIEGPTKRGAHHAREAAARVTTAATSCTCCTGSVTIDIYMPTHAACASQDFPPPDDLSHATSTAEMAPVGAGYLRCIGVAVHVFA